jgi:hypothetical protein
MIHINILAGKPARKGLFGRLVTDDRIIFKTVLNIQYWWDSLDTYGGQCGNEISGVRKLRAFLDYLKDSSPRRTLFYRAG